ncbi:MAG: hypothetical protein ACC669_05110 [bacterium]
MRLYGSRNQKYLGSIIFIACIFFLWAGISHSATSGLEFTPSDGSIFIGKKPAIEVRFDRPVDTSSLYMLLDDMDVTSITEVTSETIKYLPPYPVQGGSHTVTVQGYYEDGAEINLIWSFRVKHTQKFDQASLGADLTGIYSRALDTNDEDASTPDNRFEVTGPVLLSLIQGNKGLSLEGNLYYLEQNGSLQSAISDEGLDFRNFVLTGTFLGKKATTEFKLGDISVAETTYTIPGLARRGFHLSRQMEYSKWTVFSLNATPVFGVRDGLEIPIDTDESIIGGSVKLFSKNGQTSFNLTYLNGTENLSGSFSSSGPQVISRGDVIGLAVNRIFGDTGFSGSLEGALSRFDRDISDGSGKETDNAFNLGVLWRTSDKLDYELRLEQVGKEFRSIGNAGAVKDVRNVSLRNGIHLEKHDIGVLLYYAEDNLDSDSLIPESQYWKLEAKDDVTLSESFSLKVMGYREMFETDKEPTGFNPEDSITDFASAGLVYNRPNLSISPFASLTETDDKSGSNLDIEQREYRLDLALYPSDTFSATLTLPQIITEEKKGGPDTNNLLASVLLNIIPVKDKLFFDLSGTYSKSEVSDGSANLRVTDVSARFAYSLKKYFPDYAQPQISLSGNYRKTVDEVSSQDTDEYQIFLNLELLSNIRL